ncbi:hypothetical protein CFOL_v3_32708, partial [Cephalotus follicularis]
FYSEGFPIVEWLSAQGLEPLFSINLPSYAELIKEFYVHILSSSMDELSTKVKNKEIELEIDTLATILNVPNDGGRGWNQRTWVTSRDFDRQYCVRVLFGD